MSFEDALDGAKTVAVAMANSLNTHLITDAICDEMNNSADMMRDLAGSQGSAIAKALGGYGDVATFLTQGPNSLMSEAELAIAGQASQTWKEGMDKLRPALTADYWKNLKMSDLEGKLSDILDGMYKVVSAAQLYYQGYAPVVKSVLLEFICCTLWTADTAVSIYAPGSEFSAVDTVNETMDKVVEKMRKIRKSEFISKMDEYVKDLQFYMDIYTTLSSQNVVKFMTSIGSFLVAATMYGVLKKLADVFERMFDLLMQSSIAARNALLFANTQVEIEGVPTTISDGGGMIKQFVIAKMSKNPKRLVIPKEMAKCAWYINFSQSMISGSVKAVEKPIDDVLLNISSYVKSMAEQVDFSFSSIDVIGFWRALKDAMKSIMDDIDDNMNCDKFLTAKPEEMEINIEESIRGSLPDWWNVDVGDNIWENIGDNLWNGFIVNPIIDSIKDGAELLQDKWEEKRLDQNKKSEWERNVDTPKLRAAASKAVQQAVKEIVLDLENYAYEVSNSMLKGINQNVPATNTPGVYLDPVGNIRIDASPKATFIDSKYDDLLVVNRRQSPDSTTFLLEDGTYVYVDHEIINPAETQSDELVAAQPAGGGMASPSNSPEDTAAEEVLRSVLLEAPAKFKDIVNTVKFIKSSTSKDIEKIRGIFERM